MNSYMQQPPVTETYRGDYSGISRKELNFDRLEQFKYAIEQHVQMLTTQVQTLASHANWIEPRLNDYHKFNQWMEQAHPDIINAYKKSTAVVEKLDRADGSMAETQDIPKAAI